MIKTGEISEGVTPPEHKCCGGKCKTDKNAQTNDIEDHLTKRTADAACEAKTASK